MDIHSIGNLSDGLKIFPGVVDPADVADLQEADVTRFELIQTVPPEGKILATLKESTREFLYTAAEFKSRRTTAGGSPLKVDFPSVIQERHTEDSYPGSLHIMPLLHTLAVISKCAPLRVSLSPGATGKMSSSPEPLCHSGWKTPANDDGNYASLKTEKQLRRAKAKILSDCQKSTCSASKPQQRGYLQPTVSSRARALSPYTHRRMCQLADKAQQRLGHLHLGPHLFKKSANNPAPFSVPLSTNSSLMESYLSSSHDGAQVHGDMDQRFYSFRDDYADASLLRSSGRRDRMQWSHVRTQSSQETPSRREARPRSPAEVLNESTSLCAPAAAHSSLKERFQALDPSPSYSEQIHRRVQRILQTHKAVVR